MLTAQLSMHCSIHQQAEENYPPPAGKTIAVGTIDMFVHTRMANKESPELNRFVRDSEDHILISVGDQVVALDKSRALAIAAYIQLLAGDRALAFTSPN